MIRFEEQTHTYYDGDRQLISVTQLMAKHGLGVDYSTVDSALLEQSARRGRLIHSEIENFIKNGEISFTRECADFAKEMAKRGWKALDCEFIVYNDICAGTVDLLLDVGIADNKTTSVLHKDAVSWQLSIYNALNGYKSERAFAFHFPPNGHLEIVEVDLKPKAEVERLFECERNGEIYKPLDIATKAQLDLIEQATLAIEQAEVMKKKATKQIADTKKQVLQSMAEHGVKVYENERLRLTRCEGTEQVRIDVDRLKAEMPEIAEKYEKRTKVAEHLRIALKDEEE